MKELTFKEVAEKLWDARNLHDKGISKYGFDFYANYNPETGEKEWAYRAEVIMFADAPLVIINYYGGGAGFVYDIGEDGDASGLASCLANYFVHQGLEPSVWVDDATETPAIWLPSQYELGTRPHPMMPMQDGTMRWWLRSVEIVRKAERVVVVVENGAVTDAYATNHSISVDVIDKDVQTPEDEEALAETMNDLDADIEAGILHPVSLD